MKLHVLNTGFFKLDGGAMFGVVPKTIWQKTNPADDNNMCSWAMRSLLIEDGNRLILVDTGIDQRVIVSGIAEHYSPEDIIGKTVTVLMNLAPRTIKGIESQGMILMAENAKGELSFMSPEKPFEAGCGIH